MGVPCLQPGGAGLPQAGLGGSSGMVLLLALQLLAWWMLGKGTTPQEAINAPAEHPALPWYLVKPQPQLMIRDVNHRNSCISNELGWKPVPSMNSTSKKVSEFKIAGRTGGVNSFPNTREKTTSC